MVTSLALTFPSVARAQSAGVDNDCPSLSTAEYEELNARVLLLLRSQSEVRPPPRLVCRAAAAWLEWDGQRIELASTSPTADDVVDALSEAPPAPAVAPVPSKVRPPSAPPTPTGPGRVIDEPKRLRAARRARGGGLAVALETELPRGSVGALLGPAFDVATSAGPVLFGGREAFRFALTGRQIALMDFQALVAYGAPLRPDARLGAVLRLGGECLVASPPGQDAQAACVPLADLGLRAAHNAGVVTLWIGIDARYRLGQLQLRLREPVVIEDLSGSFTLGAAFLDWSRK